MSKALIKISCTTKKNMMPLISSAYKYAPFYLRSGHWETIFPAIVRRVRDVNYQRERLELADGDFLDLDWIKSDHQKLAILVHGLEGSTDRHYMKGMASYLSKNNYDILAMNCRSCSGEMNRHLRLYNHGETADLAAVIEHVNLHYSYQKLYLVGFSMGGSIILNYLGQRGKMVPATLKAAATFSVPTDLHGSVRILDTPKLSFYRKRFHRMLMDKIKQKALQFPEQIDINGIEKFDKWSDFDDRYSAPINGYQDANDFYTQGSANNFIAGIAIPTLLVNALNDPILTPSCFPKTLAKNNPYFYLEITARGGHVGFSWSGKKYAWSEWRTVDFFRGLGEIPC